MPGRRQVWKFLFWSLLLSSLGNVSVVNGQAAISLKGEKMSPLLVLGDPMDSSLFQQYPFLIPTSNRVINPDHLDRFFVKLGQLERGKKDRVNVVHIGDSHIQADWWTGYLRIRLQQRFGSGGRGLVFPYQLAQTNSPQDIRSGSNQSWTYRRNAFQQKHIPIGISGLSIQTSGDEVWLDLQLRHDTIIPYAFDKVNLFGQAGPEYLNWAIGGFKQADPVKVVAPPKKYHTVRSGDTLYDLARRYGTRVSRLQEWNNIRGSMIKPGQKLVVGNGRSAATHYQQLPFEVWKSLQWEAETSKSIYSTVLLDTLQNRLLMRGEKENDTKGTARIYGVSLENSRQAGLLYHAIGVNGVTYFHFNQAKEFWDQLAFLQPDLIIVSLGTNEAAHANFNEDEFSNEVTLFVKNLQDHVSSTPILLTTPADALKRKRYRNPAIQQAREAILRSAVQKNLAVWDLYELMGGPDAIKQWKTHHLAAWDYLHFTKAGYALQGELLFQALMHAYEQP